MIDEVGGAAQKSPEAYHWVTYMWVFGLSILGGIVSYARRMREERRRTWNFLEFLGELATSAFAGVITFYLCQWSGFSQLLTAAMVGISGHAGSRAIFIIQKIMESKFPGPKDDSKP